MDKILPESRSQSRLCSVVLTKPIRFVWTTELRLDSSLMVMALTVVMLCLGPINRGFVFLSSASPCC